MKHYIKNLIRDLHQKFYRKFLKLTGAKIIISENEIHFTTPKTFKTFESKKGFWRFA